MSFFLMDKFLCTVLFPRMSGLQARFRNMKKLFGEDAGNFCCDREMSFG